MSKNPKSLKDILIEWTMKIIMSVALVAVLFLVPFMVIRDTIEAGGGLVYYDIGNFHYSDTSNYVMLAISALLWWALFKFIAQYRRDRREHLEREKRKAELAKILEARNPEEKAVQAKMDETLINIDFLGFVSKDKGKFACRVCGHEWITKVSKIYNRKQCGQSNCGISYRKNTLDNL